MPAPLITGAIDLWLPPRFVEALHTHAIRTLVERAVRTPRHRPSWSAIADSASLVRAASWRFSMSILRWPHAHGHCQLRAPRSTCLLKPRVTMKQFNRGFRCTIRPPRTARLPKRAELANPCAGIKIRATCNVRNWTWSTRKRTG
nr:hypothetical protein [Burkholderia ambifaria]